MGKAIIELKSYEYVIDAEIDENAKHYEVYYKKEKLDDVTKIVRFDLEKYKDEISGKHKNKES